MTSQPLAFSYLRFSSTEQAKGDSRRRQNQMRDDWLAKTGVRLDTSVSLRDEGISAFTGEHRSNPDRHALAAFLDLVKQGRVPRGSYLIIENLDRLTREDAVPALNLFTGILSAGVRIVQLDPETVYTDKSEYMAIMMAVMELSRGNSESRNKARRMKEVWGDKRRRAAESGAVLSRACPAWIRVEGAGPSARYVLVPERAEVVRRIYRMTTDGHGARAIVKTLLEEGVPPFARRAWGVSYVREILRNPAAHGAFTPRTGRGGGGSKRRKPAGDAIPDYYPAAITPKEWLAALAATKTRNQRGGRPPRAEANVFAGLLRDARTRARLHVKVYSRKDGRKERYLTPYAAVEGLGLNVSFPLRPFERAVLSQLREVDPRSVLPAADPGRDAVLSLAGREAEIKTTLTALKAQLRPGEELGTVIDRIRELEAEGRQVADRLGEERQRAAAPAAEAWGQYPTVLAALDAAPDDGAARVKLRGVLRRMVEAVWCLFVRVKGGRVAAVQVRFVGGRHRNYMIGYQAAHPPTRRPAAWSARSFPEPAGLGEFDLSNPAHVANLEHALESVAGI